MSKAKDAINKTILDQESLIQSLKDRKRYIKLEIASLEDELREHRTRISKGILSLEREYSESTDAMRMASEKISSLVKFRNSLPDEED